MTKTSPYPHPPPKIKEKTKQKKPKTSKLHEVAYNQFLLHLLLPTVYLKK